MILIILKFKSLKEKDENSTLSFINFPIGEASDIIKNCSFLTVHLPIPIAIKKNPILVSTKAPFSTLLFFLLISIDAKRFNFSTIFSFCFE